MCGCQLSLYGNIGLRPAGDRPIRQTNLTRVQLASLAVYPDSTIVEAFPIRKNDWTTFRASNDRSDSSPVQLPSQYALAWKSTVVSDELPTAPVASNVLLHTAKPVQRRFCWSVQTYCVGGVFPRLRRNSPAKSFFNLAAAPNGRGVSNDRLPNALPS